MAYLNSCSHRSAEHRLLEWSLQNLVFVLLLRMEKGQIYVSTALCHAKTKKEKKEESQESNCF